MKQRLVLCSILLTSVLALHSQINIISLSSLIAISKCTDTSCVRPSAGGWGGGLTFVEAKNNNDSTVSYTYLDTTGINYYGRILKVRGLTYHPKKKGNAVEIQVTFQTENNQEYGSLLKDMKDYGFKEDNENAYHSAFYPGVGIIKKENVFIRNGDNINQLRIIYSTILEKVDMIFNSDSYGSMNISGISFTGYLKNGVPAVGTFKFPNGNILRATKFQFDWWNKLIINHRYPNLQGVLTYPDGSQFFGYFNNDDYKPYSGIIRKPDGELLTLLNTNDAGFNGYIISAKGDIYCGTRTKNGQKSGGGMLLNVSGEVYYGGFNDNLYEGTGVLFYPDRRKMLAIFSKGTPVGKGLIIYPDGRTENKQFSQSSDTLTKTFIDFFKRELKGEPIDRQPDGGIFVKEDCYINDKMDIYKDKNGNIFDRNRYDHSHYTLERYTNGEIFGLNGQLIRTTNGDIEIIQDFYNSVSIRILKNGDIFGHLGDYGIYIDMKKNECYLGGFLGDKRNGNGTLFKLNGKPQAVKYKFGVLVK